VDLNVKGRFLKIALQEKEKEIGLPFRAMRQLCFRKKVG
jgi:hypothetical protein